MDNRPVIYDKGKWRVIDKKRSNYKNSVYVYQVIIGEKNNPAPYNEICTFISKDNYDNIMSGKYSFIKAPYSQEGIVIFDENNKIVPLINVENIEEESIKRM